ncbi:MAG TPA: DUF1015 domain-containing protein, partial [Thermoanaerobaculia bacterium]|nr:DUF1015 domain-containing protein [Thermoanaerobaculia bacterium]
MASVRPFRALRPSSENAARVSAVPYDVVSTEEARRLAAGNPLSFLHVSRAEIDLADGTDPYSDAVYAKARENFEKLKREAPLSVEESPSLYVYRLRMGGQEQTGIAGAYSLDEYDEDIIRKHERARRDKEDDRTRHMLALGAQTGPVFLTYRDRPEIDQIVAEIKRERPLFEFTAPDGVAHTIWRVGGETAGRLAEQFRPVPLLYIADGHHRAASAARARSGLAEKSAKKTGEEACNFFLAVAFPAGQVRILPYNRVVKDLNGRSPAEFLSALEEKFSVAADVSPSPRRKGEISVYLAGRWYGLLIPPGGVATGGAISSLDAAMLQEKVLEPLLGIQDIRTDKRIDFIGGIRGTRELERLVDSGRAAVAFSLYPVSVDDLIAVSDAKEI